MLTKAAYVVSQCCTKAWSAEKKVEKKEKKEKPHPQPPATTHCPACLHYFSSRSHPPELFLCLVVNE